MSADNWAVCPRCLSSYNKELEAALAQLQKNYGKVTPAEFLQQNSQMIKRHGKEPDVSFREDYEIGIHGDKFSIDYYGKCEVCGLTVTHKFEKSVI